MLNIVSPIQGSIDSGGLPNAPVKQSDCIMLSFDVFGTITKLLKERLIEGSIEG